LNPFSLVVRPRRGGWSAATQVTGLVAAVLVPALLLALLIADQLVKSTRAQAEQTTLHIARELANDVDRQLLNVKQMLKIFANSHALQIGDVAAFQHQAYEFAQQT
jgi:sensor histidine kinase regulating citrate/malate metabolism